MKFHVRIDENQKTPAQIVQRDRTYEAAELLRTAGFDCEVTEYFTGDSENANAAGIHLKLDQRTR